MIRALLVATVLALAACGDPSSGITAVTVGPTSTSTSTTTTTAPVTSVPAGASATDLRDATAAVLGPTPDIGVRVAPLITLPAGIPTPRGTEINDFSLHVYKESGALESYYRAGVSFTTSASIVDLQTFFEAKLRAAGYTRTGLSTQQGDTRDTIQLTYRLPAGAATYESAELSVQLVNSTMIGMYVSLEVTDGLPEGVFERLNSWMGPMPGLESMRIDDVHLSTIIGESVSLGIGGVVLGTPLNAVLDGLRAGLPSELYRLDPEDDSTGTTIGLVRDGFYDVSVSANARDVDTYVSVYGGLDFVTPIKPSSTTTAPTG